MKYPETKQTLDALINLNADKDYVSFEKIYEEVKRIRLIKGLKKETKNLKGRVRRSLVNDSITGMVRNTEQSKQFSIMANYPYSVLSQKNVAFNEKQLTKSQEVEKNSYLIRKEKNYSK